jgi:cellulose synthase/poly-beta-1,6-N-acetylglucosamine synthase-like glycosyltransferase
MEFVIIGLYIFFLSFILLYAIAELNLTFAYLRDKSKTKGVQEKSFNNDGEKPFVTIQLPVYNELYVIERLIDAVANFDWPIEKLEIQVLDDSNDETVEIIANKVKEWRQKGIDITQVIRPKREGFKAGALAYGMNLLKGEYIAIFDADFVPEPDFLNRTIPYFEDDKIGVVQTRWGHLNKGYSILTKLQAFALDAHFKIEQRGRNSRGHFINFNGTAGIWRKTTIEDSGGWQSDTLTEDLDLSYRAQLKGWKFKYLEDVESPAELPVTMTALKSQQFRWSKGAAECTRKNLGKVLIKRGIGLKTKINATFHLLNSFLFICVISLVLLSIPAMLVINQFPQYDDIFRNSLSFFFVSTIILGIIYFVANKSPEDNFIIALFKFILFFPMFLALTMGIGLYNAIGVVEGYLGKKSPFIRTPKFNVNTKSDSLKANKYVTSSFNPMAILEFLLVLYAGYGIYVALQFQNHYMLVFLVMIAVGFGYTSFYTVKHGVAAK